jgi:ABC-type sugar transport system substrate-binding protein
MLKGTEKNTMKKIVALLLVLAMTLALAACGQTPVETTAAPAADDETAAAPATENAEETYKVGISMFVMDAGMTALSGLMKETLENADIPIEVYITSADSSTDKQNADVEDLVTKGCDLIWIQGFDRDAIVSSLESAYNAGVKLALGAVANSDAYTYRYCNASDEQTGYMQADWFVENYLKKNPDKTYKIAMCNGTMSTAGGAGRRNGVVWGLENSGCTNYEIVVEQDNNYITETAQAWAEGLMTSHPEVDVIFCGNDDMAMGVANAIDAVGRTGEIVLLGTDGQDTGLSLMKEGKMAATVRMNVMEIGVAMANSMIECLKGTLEVGEDKISYADASKIYTMVDESNYESFLQ